MVVAKDVCSSQSSKCPLPIQGGWSTSGAYQVDDGPSTQSDPFAPGAWDDQVTAMLALDGMGFYINDRMTLHFDGGASPAFLDGHAMLVSDNLTVTYPGGASYTVDVGLVRAHSLFSSHQC